MELLHVKDLSGIKLQTYFVHWKDTENEKYFVDKKLEQLSEDVVAKITEMMERLANGSLNVKNKTQYSAENFRNFKDYLIYAIKYKSHRFYLIYDEISGNESVIYFHYYCKKSQKPSRKEIDLICKHRKLYIAQTNNSTVRIIEDTEGD